MTHLFKRDTSDYFILEPLQVIIQQLEEHHEKEKTSKISFLDYSCLF